MASSRVIATSSSGKSNISRQSSLYPKPSAELQNSTSDGDPPKSLGSMVMDDLIRNMYGDNVPPVSPYAGCVETPSMKSGGVMTAEDVWREITVGRQAEGGGEVDAFLSESESKDAGEMTLEDFLARAGAVIEEEVRVSSGVHSAGQAASDQFVQQPLTIENPVRVFGNGTEVVSIGGGRGRRRHLLDPEDRITLQRQKRMIKNRESAARSRERKQAYTAELESLVHQLEQENAQLHIELEQVNKERFKQLMAMEVPFTMKNKPPRQVRRTSSG
ncbi:ABSCISIC ACID-INSENSITIVE 5-like protein 5 [Phalaenopsis equestris]|uniref:ABSCISIC ACID-INSENSITIVE 5-like protein 5 n=1 Tax=Phalaenopsis equestris TaxID=78828 RepID=UPI0009E313D4|nr:ABSCISIC ACID-INSENSITIVE 5-like protein 5 [Phalaenopsis equestris]